jgi:hypothetical protein
MLFYVILCYFILFYSIVKASVFMEDFTNIKVIGEYSYFYCYYCLREDFVERKDFIIMEFIVIIL